VVEEQVDHLVARGRYEEAMRHAEPALAGAFTCSTQPQGVLTALLPALVALGEVDRARNAHLTAYRRSRDQAGQGYVGVHLEFCAVTGNVQRGMDILRRHLDQVHNATSPIGTMNFAASAALLLSRLDPVELRRTQLAVPIMGGGTETVSAQDLRAALESSALQLAARFDERNGTSRQSDRIRAVLDAKDSIRVPLAVPTPASARAKPETITVDPVELANQAHQAYEENDFLTGYRLLRSVPADLDPLLPADLAARLAARRVVVFAPPLQPESVIDDLAAAVQRLRDVGELDQAARFLARFGMLQAEAGDLDAGIETAEEAFAQAERYSPVSGRILVRLILCELLDHQHEHERAGALLAEARQLAEEYAPERVSSVLLESADHYARQRDLDIADRLLAEAMADPRLRPGDRFHGLRARAAVAEVRGDVELALSASAELVAFVRDYPGPWVADVLLQRGTILDNFDRAGDHLAELVELVAVCRAESTSADTARACYLLSSGYLERGRLVEAAEALEESLRLLPETDEEGTLRIRFRLGSVCAELGEHADAKRHFEAMLDLVSEAALPSQATVWASLGEANNALGDLIEAERCHRVGAELWERAERPIEACRAWIKTAAVAADDRPAIAMEALGHAYALVPDNDPRLTAEVLELRGYTHAREERYIEALADNVYAAELAKSLDEPDWQIFLMVRAARVHIATDHAPIAEQLARDAAELLGEETPQSIVARILDVLTRALEAQDKQVHPDPLARALTTRLRS
jgi:tetratricopeptide (TPR) repeat protein